MRVGATVSRSVLAFECESSVKLAWSCRRPVLIRCQLRTRELFSSPRSNEYSSASNLPGSAKGKSGKKKRRKSKGKTKDKDTGTAKGDGVAAGKSKSEGGANAKAEKGSGEPSATIQV